MKLNGIIEAKLQLMLNGLQKLNGLHIETFEEFKSDYFRLKGIERSFQVLVEIVIDIAQRLVSIQQLPPAPSSAEAVLKLKDLGVIQTADPYVAMVKFRNYLVHHYDSLDEKVLFDIFKNRLGEFRSFFDQVVKYVSTQ